MKQLLDDFKFDVICHYLEGHNFDLNINPSYWSEGRKYTPEEELILAMYVQEEMPYLELYEQEGEIKFRKIAEISLKDQLIYFKYSYNQLRDEHNKLHNAIERISEGVY